MVSHRGPLLSFHVHWLVRDVSAIRDSPLSLKLKHSKGSRYGKVTYGNLPVSFSNNQWIPCPYSIPMSHRMWWYLLNHDFVLVTCVRCGTVADAWPPFYFPWSTSIMSFFLFPKLLILIRPDKCHLFQEIFPPTPGSSFLFSLQIL